MSFALTADQRAWIEARVASGEFGNASEFLRELIRRDQERQAQLRLTRLIVQGLESGPARRLDAQLVVQWQAPWRDLDAQPQDPHGHLDPTLRRA